MKKTLLLLSVCLGLYIISCTENMKIDTLISEKSLTLQKITPRSIKITDSIPTGLVTLKSNRSTTAITISSNSFSRGKGVPVNPWLLYEKGILISTSPATPIYSGGNLVDLMACGCNCDCGISAFSVTISTSTPVINLQPNVLYNVRTYAIQSSGPVPPHDVYVGYGEIESFYLNKPYVIGITAQNITGTTCQLQSFFDDQGASAITDIGFCWGTTSNPTLSGSHAHCTIQSGDDWYFNSNLSNLQPSTLYYARTFVINTQGTFYGNQITFNTPACPQFATTGGYVTISPTSIDNGVPTNVNATINNKVSGLNVAVSASTDYNCSPSNSAFNWNGNNPCWNQLYKNATGSGAYTLVTMTLTKTGCPTDVKQAKIYVNQ
jgi:hypothetical protein